MNKLISIIIPIYNCEKYLRTCLESVINQTYKNIEIILVNDGSTDKSLDVCNEYSNKDSRIKIINNTNHGVSYSRNIGIKSSTGSYIMFVDADDWLDLKMVEILYRNINNSDLCVCSYISVFNNNSIPKIYNITKNNSYMQFILKNGCWAPWGKLFKKEKITKLFDEKIMSSEDLLFNFENAINFKIIKYISDTLYYYRKKDDEKFKIEKVGKKELGELDALVYMINNSNDDICNYLICNYIDNLYRVIYFDNLNTNSTFLNKEYYVNLSKEYYKKLDKKKLSIKKNLKNYLIVKFPSIYFKMLKIKLSRIKYK